MVTNMEITNEGIEIYTHKIYSLADEYIQTQLDGNAEKVTDYFRDMIFFIADRLERPDNNDIDTLDNIFGAYVRLCAKYRKLPTLECYSWLVKINRATFTDWSKGEYRSSTSHSNTVKKWFNICKGFAVDELSNSKYANPNLIFTAKAAYGMRETAPIPTMGTEKREVLSIDELPKLRERIAETYGTTVEEVEMQGLPKLPEDDITDLPQLGWEGE